jgi:RNA methyltransferase, TrmH family
VAEGRREVERAFAAGLAVDTVYVAPELIGDWHGDRATEVTTRVLKHMSYRAEPEGVLAVVEIPSTPLPESATLLLVAVGIEKPGNLGAMARTADAAGADALLIADAHVDPWNPNAIRASTGAVFTLPVVEATLEELKALRAELVAATTDATTSYTDADLTNPLTVAVGAEDKGLPKTWLDAADRQITIPLAPGATDSLNAATAAAIVLFEARRQRAHA